MGLERAVEATRIAVTCSCGWWARSATAAGRAVLLERHITLIHPPEDMPRPANIGIWGYAHLGGSSGYELRRVEPPNAVTQASHANR